MEATLNDFDDNHTSVSCLSNWFESVGSGNCTKPALLLHGVTGSGKTTLVKLLLQKYTNIHPVFCSTLDFARINGIKTGVELPWGVHDYFNGTCSKKVVLIWDNIDLSTTFNKKLFSAPMVVPVLCVIDGISFRQWKSYTSNHVLITRPCVKQTVDYIRRTTGDESVSVSKLTAIVQENNCDIRGVLNQIEAITLLDTVDGHKTLDDKWIRDPCLATQECITKVYEGYRKNKKIASWQERLIEQDKYNGAFFLGENYPGWVLKNDTNKRALLADCFSTTELHMNNKIVPLDYVSYIGIRGPIVTCDKMTKKARISNAVSRKNQTIIHDNRFRKMKSRFGIRNYPCEDVYLYAKIKGLRGCGDKDITWMNRQFFN